MKILVDTAVRSLALRRPAGKLGETQQHIVNELKQLIADGRVLMVGPVRQELLSGIKEEPYFNRVRSNLRASPMILSRRPTSRLQLRFTTPVGPPEWPDLPSIFFSAPSPSVATPQSSQRIATSSETPRSSH